MLKNDKGNYNNFFLKKLPRMIKFLDLLELHKLKIIKVKIKMIFNLNNCVLKF